MSIVQYFLRLGGEKYWNAFDKAVCANVRADRRMRSATRMFFWMYAVIIAGVVANNIPALPYGHEIGVALLVSAVTGWVVFSGWAMWNWREVAHFCWFDRWSAETSAVHALKEAISTFKKAFGKRPEKLGQTGVAKRLTRLAKKILKLQAKGLDDYWPKLRFGQMFDAAKALMPMPQSYESIYAAAKAGAKMPMEWPRFPEQQR